MAAMTFLAVAFAALGQDGYDEAEAKRLLLPYYALARFNYRGLWVERRDKEIWRVDVETRNDIYLTSVVGEISLDELQAAAKAPPSPKPNDSR